jgi:two-component system KDP operon response regulator KdpE
MPRSTILIVDDEPELVELLQDWLQEEGFDVHSATDSAEGLRLFFQLHPVLTITDLRMPGMDGFQLISRIREMSDSHVLVVTALEGEEYMIRGLGLGADDFLVKPVSKLTLLAKVRALLRRAPATEEAATGYVDNRVSLNYLTHEAEVRGQPMDFTPTEFKLLAYLCTNQDRVASHQEILDKVWGDPYGSLDSLKWYIHSLREKLEDSPPNPRLILTVPGVGYRYRPETQETQTRSEVGGPEA